MRKYSTIFQRWIQQLTTPVYRHTTHVKGSDINSLWNAEDRPVIIANYFNKVKFLRMLSYEDTKAQRLKIIQEYNDKQMKCYNDHRNVLINEHTHPSTFFQPIQVSPIDNLIVEGGLTKLTEQIANASTTWFTFLEVGENNTGHGKLNNRLQAPVYRLNVMDLGWFEPHGNTLFTGSVFPEDIRSFYLKEIGGFDAGSDPSTMFWRIVITELAKILHHIVGETYVSVSHIHTFE